MSSYSNGQDTKNKIYEVCKRVFYDEGFKETSFNKICKIADVNPGTIAYHFQSKHNVGVLIYQEMLETLVGKAYEFYPDETPFFRCFLTCCMHMYYLFNDPKYRRFSLAIVSELNKAGQVGFYSSTCGEAYEYLKEISPEKADFVFAAHRGLDFAIESYIDSHFEELKYENVVTYSIEIYFSYVNNELRDALTKKAIDSMSELSLENDRFDLLITRK